jgi:hypothetical protein
MARIEFSQTEGFVTAGSWELELGPGQNHLLSVFPRKQ